MSRLKELIAELCPDGVEYKALGEVGQFLRGSSFQKKHFTEAGMPCIHYGQVHTQFGLSTNQAHSFLDDSFAVRMKRAQQGDLIIATTSEDDEAVGKATAWMGDFDVVVSNDAFIYRHTLDPMYVSYFFASDQFQQAKMPFITGAKVRRLSGDDMSKIRIPVPPIEVQREIVRILDAFRELNDALTAEIEAREKQFQYARSECFERYFGNPVSIELGKTGAKLGDLYTISSSKRIYQSEQVTDGVPFLRVADLISLIDNEDVTPELFISDATYTDLQSANYVPRTGDILVTARGTLGRYYFVQKDDRFYFQDGMITWLKQKDNSPSKYYFEALFSDARFLERLISNCGQGTVKYLSIKGLAETRVPVPDEAKMVLFDNEMNELDSLNRLLKSLRLEREARRKQFAYYRDKLLAFPELNKGIDK